MMMFARWSVFLGCVAAFLSAWAVPAPRADAFRTFRDAPAGGLRPSPTDFSHLRSAAKTRRMRKGGAALQSGEAPLPARWDARDRGWTTPVRNQNPWGTCWTFATCAALETAFLKTSATTNDFSENHLAAHDVGFAWGFDDGGNNQMAMALLLAWRDPLREEEDPYPCTNAVVSLPPACHVQDVVLLPARTVTHTNSAEDVRAENEILQRAVRKYGALAIGYEHTWSGFSETTGAHYYRMGMTSAGGHAVTLVGWDDDYPTNNFVAAYRPPANGAFLVKNSWGPSRGDAGYAWISYYDDGLCRQASAAYPQPEATNNYGRVYQYDPCGQVETWNVYLDAADQAQGGKEQWAANVFTSVATGIVEAVGFYALTYDTAYEIRLYAGCGDTPSSGTLVATQTGVVADPGYATIRLETPVAVGAAEKFAVAVKFDAPDYLYPVPVECSYSGYCTATSRAGESFLSPDGADWTDFKVFPGATGTENVCIKAYTRFGADGPVVEPVLDVWVDAGAAVEDADGTPNHPFAAFDAAFAVVGEGGVVHVRPGVYRGTVSAPASRIEIRSTDGPSVTVLDAGDGTCCYDGGGCRDTLLAGFTLRGGSCQYGGGAFYGVLSNCVITACEANCGGGAFQATLTDCTLAGNVAYGYGGGAYGCLLQRCSVVGNVAAQGGSGVDYGSVCSNTVLWANYSSAGALDNWEKHVSRRGTVYAPRLEWCCTTPSGYAGGTGCLDVDPLLADAAAGDVRLRRGSPCLGAGVDGCNIGSWQGAGVEGYVLTATSTGGGRVEPASVFVEPGGSATFTASDDHPLQGFLTNGVFATAASVFTWTDVQADGEVVAAFTSVDFHVDAAAGDDAATGWTPSEAKKTLQAAVDVAAAGETIRVAPGVYGGIAVPADKTNLLIAATAGASATVLDGGGTMRCLDDYAATTLRGFTLANGAAPGDYGGGAYCGRLEFCVVSNCTAGAGGGAAGAVLEGCLVVGNAANAGGGAYECQLRGCTVASNRASLYGGGAYLDQGSAVNTIVATNICAKGYANGNDVYGNAYWTMVCSSSDEDVRFVDAARGDYRLRIDSPCIDAGTNDLVSLEHDLDGRPRIVGRTVDRGCYERALVPEGWLDPGVASGDTAAEEAGKVADALRSQGFATGSAAAAGTLRNYAALGEWAAEKGVGKAELAASPAPLLSAALGGAGPVAAAADVVRISSWTDGPEGWTLGLALSGYAPGRVHAGLLRAAVGVEGATAPEGPYAAAGLSPVTEPGPTNVTIRVTPPQGPRAFLRARVR